MSGDGMSMKIWHKYDDKYCHSARHNEKVCDVERSGTIDLRPHDGYVHIVCHTRKGLVGYRTFRVFRKFLVVVWRIWLRIMVLQLLLRQFILNNSSSVFFIFLWQWCYLVNICELLIFSSVPLNTFNLFHFCFDIFSTPFIVIYF